LALPGPPTALFCSNNRNTIGAFRAVRAAGSATALAGFDDFELADVLGLPLVIAAYDSDELGREAGRLLVRRLGEGAA
ncbi:LacI family transcriptional regulator, partial [Streptomyces sp. SID14478]|uniref:substrate-binding domain-containing protein n=1 Tax=Streptomyces sp. SID14478 TaxID=2706073 RepID=UPI0013DAE0AF